jgi:hypothetical protein
MKVRWDPQQQRFPALAGKLVVDTYRGTIRVRRWPKKRGTPKSQAVRDQNEWFAGANRLTKHIEPTETNLAIAMTLGTGLYPRDLLLRQMAGGMYELVTHEGRVIEYQRNFRETIVFQGVILQLLVNQSIGTNTLTLITFPLPVRDTAGFWNAGAPTRVTIPEGINVVKIVAGWNGTASSPNRRQIIAIYKNGAIHRVQDGYSWSTPAQTIGAGADAVVVGDYFEIKCLSVLANSALGAGRTFLTLNVLDAD